MTTVHQILDRYILTTGGVSAYRQLTTQVIRGRVTYSTGEVGTVEFYRKAPDRYLEAFSYRGEEQFREGFNGTQGWKKSRQGVNDYPPIILQFFRREADPQRFLKLTELYLQVTYQGQASLEDRLMDVLTFTVIDQPDEQWYFDARTGLLQRRDYHFAWEQGADDYEWRFDDYRRVDGIWLPFWMKELTPSPLEIEVTEVQHNLALEDSLFDRPVG